MAGRLFSDRRRQISCEFCVIYEAYKLHTFVTHCCWLLPTDLVLCGGMFQLPSASDALMAMLFNGLWAYHSEKMCFRDAVGVPMFS